MEDHSSVRFLKVSNFGLCLFFSKQFQVFWWDSNLGFSLFLLLHYHFSRRFFLFRLYLFKMSLRNHALFFWVFFFTSSLLCHFFSSSIIEIYFPPKWSVSDSCSFSAFPRSVLEADNRKPNPAKQCDLKCNVVVFCLPKMDRAATKVETAKFCLLNDDHDGGLPHCLHNYHWLATRAIATVEFTEPALWKNQSSWCPLTWSSKTTGSSSLSWYSFHWMFAWCCHVMEAVTHEASTASEQPMEWTSNVWKSHRFVEWRAWNAHVTSHARLPSTCFGQYELDYCTDLM